MMDSIETHWVISDANPKSRTGRMRHKSRAKAIKEATRLASKLGCPFHVLEAIGVVSPEPALDTTD